MRLRESLLSRRWFLTGLISGSLGSLIAFLTYPVARFLFHQKKLPLPKAVTVMQSDLEKIAPNSVVYFQYGYLPGILLKTENGEFRVFSAKCTHLDCNVRYLPQTKKFYCACHEGYFDDRGKNIAGPPPSPLLAFSLRREGEVMVISHPEKDAETVS